jgi:hypothetical protein
MLRARYEPSLRYIFQPDTSSTCVDSLRDSANSHQKKKFGKKREKKRKEKKRKETYLKRLVTTSKIEC